MKKLKVSIEAVEYFLPPKIEDGSTLKIDNPEWRIDDIETKTGIRNRHIAELDQTVTDMALPAANIIFSKGVSKEEIDFIIFITQSPDYALPPSACILQDKLSLQKSIIAFDVNHGCSGFIYGLAIGGALIESGFAGKGLVICSETYTKYIDKFDRTCRPIFSDGASAALLSSSEHYNLGPFYLGTDGSGFKNLIVNSGISMGNRGEKPVGRLFMDGPKVFMFTMDMVPKCVNALLKEAGKTINDIDLFIFHQASKLVIDNIIRHLNLPVEKVYINYHKIGNTVSASIPIALKYAVDEKRLKKGDQVMLVGFGVGYSWGACLIQWNGIL